MPLFVYSLLKLHGNNHSCEFRFKRAPTSCITLHITHVFMQRSVSPAKAAPNSTFSSPLRRHQRSRSLERSPTSDDGTVAPATQPRRRALPVQVFAVIAPPPVSSKQRPFLNDKSNTFAKGRTSVAQSRNKAVSVQSPSPPPSSRDPSVFVDIKEVKPLLMDSNSMILSENWC